MSRLWLPVLALSAVLLSCNPGSSTCAPGRAEACTCSTGAMGSQSCNTTGDGFGECQCAAVACARGFQDNDDDGTCTASCASAPSCGAHGRCDDVSGTASCACDEGYTGADCTACAAGFQDADTNGTCTPSCATAMRGCGLGGRCEETSGTATCVCATPFTGASCARCADGFQDNDGNNTCEPACVNDSCNLHGSCVDTTGRAVCTCTAGFGGATCAGCAAGFQDNDNNGTCTASCATAGLSCDRRSSCSDATGTATCACVPGFTAGALPDGGQGCLFTGGVADPGFQNRPANAWSTTPDAGWVFAPDAGGIPDAGSDLAGVVTLPAAVRRSLDATLRQTFLLAGSQARQGLRLNLLKSSPCYPRCNNNAPLLLQLNDVTWRVAIPFLGTALYSTCVGEGALGNQTTLTVSGHPTSYANSDSVVIDRLWIDPDDACPGPGEVINGRFQTTDATGWTFQGAGTSILPQAGVNGSGALRIMRPARCDPAGATGQVSVPLAATLPNAALRFTFRGTPGRTMVTLDGMEAEVAIAFEPSTQLICLPDSMRGRVVPLTLQLLPAGGGTCAPFEGQFMEIDDVEVVSEPTRCPARLPFGDGSFESGASPLGWFVPRTTCASPCSTGNRAGGLTDAAQARTGSGVGRISVQQRCAIQQMEMPAIVPARNATGGPALRFHYRLPSLNTTQANAQAYVTVDGTQTNLPLAAAWTPRVLCLESGRPGRTAEISFAVKGTNGYCDEEYAAPDQLFIDDLLVTNDPSCP